jgi:hypothetical protein
MTQNNTNQANSQDEPSQNGADKSPIESIPGGSQKEGEPKKLQWRDWVLLFIAAASIANGAAEISEIRNLNTVIDQHSTRAPRDDRSAKRDLFTSTEAQVKEIKEFVTRNRDEIRSVDHYNTQLTLHAQTAIDFANEAVSKSPEDTLIKAIKKQIEILESRLGPESERRRKRTLEEVYDLAKDTQDLLELCKHLRSLWAINTRPFADVDEAQSSDEVYRAIRFLGTHDRGIKTRMVRASSGQGSVITPRKLPKEFGFELRL